jgi:outer membrane protein TolC
LAWWELFKDPALQGLIGEALKNNNDAQNRRCSSGESAGSGRGTRSVYFPRIGYGAKITGQRGPLVPTGTYYGYNLKLRGSWTRGDEFAASTNSSELCFVPRKKLDAQLVIAKDTGKSFQESYSLLGR